MNQPGNYLENLAVGMKVEVNPQRDKSRTQRVEGDISKILTRSPQHSHGILVELCSGEIGRVKNILNSATPKNSNTGGPEENETTQEDLLSLITKGENHFVEYKSSALWSFRLSDQQIQESNSKEVTKYRRNASKFIIAKTIAGFLNSDGGNLIIGLKENKTTNKDEIIGIEYEFEKLQDQCTDGYRRMILEGIIKKFFPSSVFNSINKYINIDFERFGGKLLCHIIVFKANKQVFLNSMNERCLFVRIDASTRELRGAEAVEFCMERFT